MTTSTEETSKTISPFKEKDLFEKEIIEFANRFKTTVVTQSKRISDYFEMSCFNMIVKFYELHGYELNVKNLIGKQYRYKCSPSGIQSNFSFFEATIIRKGIIYKFEIQHNLAVQSSHDLEVFTTPDISIILAGSVKVKTDYYTTNRKFCYVENSRLFTFCEVKQFNPFPELLFNFIGVLNELRKDYMVSKAKVHGTNHIAPSLMISGKSNKQTDKIKKSLESRYCINILYDLFHSSHVIFSKTNLKNIRIVGK